MMVLCFCLCTVLFGVAVIVYIYYNLLLRPGMLESCSGELTWGSFYFLPVSLLKIATVNSCQLFFISSLCVMMTGSTDTLGTELLESLLKMAPSKEEEWKLREFKDESPFKLGSAEKFLKAVLDIPFAFKRVDAMLYIANFELEVEYLRRSFETLEVNFTVILFSLSSTQSIIWPFFCSFFF